jgi:hypothetical protein
MVSVVPPAGAPTKILMGGCVWACAQPVKPAQAKAALSTQARREVVGRCEMDVFVMWLSSVSKNQSGV